MPADQEDCERNEEGSGGNSEGTCDAQALLYYSRTNGDKDPRLMVR